VIIKTDKGKTLVKVDERKIYNRKIGEIFISNDFARSNHPTNTFREE
jgi:hypothetical protein